MAQGLGLWSLALGGILHGLKGVAIAASSSGDNALVAAVAGKSIVVMSVLLIASAEVTVKFRTAGTDITGAMALAANGGFSADARHGILATAAGEALNLNLSDAETVGGCLTYVEL